MKQLLPIKNIKLFAWSLTVAAGVATISLVTPTLHAIEADASTYAQAYKAGYEAESQRHFDQARIQWEQAIKLASTPKEKANAQIGLAGTLLGLKQYGQAEALIKELQHTPVEVISKTTVLQLLAQLYAAQGKTKEATQATKEMFESAPKSFPGIKFNPDGTLAPLTLADAQQFIYGSLIGDVTGKTPGQIQAALENLAKNSKAPDDKRQQAKILVGNFLMTQGKPAEARAFYLDTNLGFAGNSPILQIDLLTRIGDTYAAQRNWREAVKAYDRALAVDVSPTYKSRTQQKRDADARLAQSQ